LRPVHVPLRSILDLLVVGIVLAAPASGAAQVFGGHIVDYRTRRPSGNLLVEALRTESVVATARTDSAGIFYLQVKVRQYAYVPFQFAINP